MKKAIQIDGRDNVATVTALVDTGEVVEVLSESGVVIREVRASSVVPQFHKLAIAEIPLGVKVVKYGETIGIATKRMGVGDWVHVDSVESAAVPTSAFRRPKA